MEKENHKELLEYFLHEVTQLNANIKLHSELLSKGGVNDKNSIAHHSNLVNENSTILSVLIDIINYKLNPDFFNSMQRDYRNLHGKFYKIILSLKNQLKQKNIKINLNSDFDKLVNLFPIIDTLPYLLIDNALKYSPKGGDIDIYLSEIGKDIRIEVQNIGPVVFENERSDLFKRGFRGKNAIDLKIKGSGIGLDVVHYITELHKGKIFVEYGSNSFNLNGVDYQSFKIVIDLPNS